MLFRSLPHNGPPAVTMAVDPRKDAQDYIAEKRVDILFQELGTRLVFARAPNHPHACSAVALGRRADRGVRVAKHTCGRVRAAILASAFNDWMNSYLEEKNVNELRDHADRKMKAFAKEKKGQSMIMVDRMAKSKDNGILQQSLIIWRIGQDLDRVMGNYLEEKELLKAFINKQKEKSKTVVDRMLKGNDSARYSMAWQSWVQEVSEIGRAHV